MMKMKITFLFVNIFITYLLSTAQINNENKIKFLDQTFLPIAVGTQTPTAIGSKVNFFSASENENYIGGVSYGFDSLWLVQFNGNLEIKFIQYFSISEFNKFGIDINNTLESIAVFQNQVYFLFSNGTIILIDEFDDRNNYKFQFITKFGIKNSINTHELFPIAKNEFIIIGNRMDSVCSKSGKFEMLIYKCLWNGPSVKIGEIDLDLNRFLIGFGRPKFYAHHLLKNELLFIEPLTGKIISFNIKTKTSKSYYIKNRLNSYSDLNKYLYDEKHYYSLDMESQNEDPYALFKALSLLDRYYSIHFVDSSIIHILKYKSDKNSLIDESLFFDLQNDMKLIDSISFKKTLNSKDCSTIDSFNYPIEINHYPYVVSGNNLFIMSFEIKHGSILGIPLNLYINQRKDDLKFGNLSDFKLSIKKFEIPIKAQ